MSNMFRFAVLTSSCAMISAQDLFLQPAPWAQKPHILLILADDLGYGNVGWLRKEAGAETPEVQTPKMDKLVAEGIQLSRFYAFPFCSPSRSSLQTGRLPMHVNMVNAAPIIYNASESSGTGAGIPRNMTGIAQKLKSAGYKTHMAGKWDAGMATRTHTPHGRGYDTALCYFGHANSYWTETGGNHCPGKKGSIDFFDTTEPAWGLNGHQGHQNYYNVSAYEDHIFVQRLMQTIEKHDASVPLFMFFASHAVHLPYMVPQQYLDKFSKAGGGPFDNSTKQDNMRMIYHAMANFLDDTVGNLTDALKSKGMWENTLVLFASDNGGPIYVGGNNYPLRGGKYSQFEGGVRVAAFASGGILPKAVRGTKHNGIAHLADVYSTLSALAGVDPTDAVAEGAGLPPVDGLDLSGMLLHKEHSPRTEVALQPMKVSDMSSWDDYDNYTQHGIGKAPECWAVELCDLQDETLEVMKNVQASDCCDLCNNTAGCAASVFTNPKGSLVGTCYLKSSAKRQVFSHSKVADSQCFLSGSRPMPKPITHGPASFLLGDMKLITGVQIHMSAWTGLHFPNASTHWVSDQNMFDCSTLYKIGCLFNITADPTEHHDLAVAMPEVAQQLLNRFRIVSKTRFDPKRGEADPAACDQLDRNHNFYGPWLP